jgi:hypothetical protein
VGGEWYDNSHPDFLWVPRKGSIASLSFDKAAPKYRGTLNPQVEKAAPEASREGYPLCSVLSYLVNKSKTTEDSYVCE